MCVLIFLRGVELATVGELRRALPANSRIAPAHYDNMRTYAGNMCDADCLCVVDIPRTLDAAGVAYRQIDTGDFEILKVCGSQTA